MEFSQQRLVSGLKLMVWGFFKKLVIADRLGVFVSYVYENPAEHKGLTVILATVLFAFQLYCDFSYPIQDPIRSACMLSRSTNLA